MTGASTSLRRGAQYAALLLVWMAAASAPAAEGHWEGALQVPGGAVPVVIDLERRGSTWIGSALLPGRSVPAARLRELGVDAAGTVRATLPLGSGGTLAFELWPSRDGRRLEGQGRHAGHRAPLALVRTGAAHVAPVPNADPLAPALAGVWRGRYDIGFGPREVTLRIAPPGAAMTIVGRRTTEVAFDEVLQHGALVRLRASEFDIVVEAPWAGAAQGELAASWSQGPFETTLVLRREGAP